jgi:thiamine-monophosphate kinase
MTPHIKSEADFLDLIEAHFDSRGPHFVLGRGDDAAVVACPMEMCVTSDLFIQDVHFRTDYFEPEEVGHKALAVNLSDVAAMGAAPLGFSLQLFGPPDTPREYWDRLLSGMAALSRREKVVLTGGDLAVGPVVGLGVTVWGCAAAKGRFLSRGGVIPGDKLFLVGEVGLARTGLLALEAEGRVATERFPKAVAAHLRPMAEIEAGQILARQDKVRGLMDVSDGLARDLPRFLAAGAPLGYGADLDLPVHPEVAAYAKTLGKDPVEMTFLGGEDYALLGGIAPDVEAEFLATLPRARIIGTVTDNPSITLGGKPATIAGFDHFGGAS